VERIFPVFRRFRSFAFCFFPGVFLWLTACSFIPQQATEIPQSAPFCNMLEAARLGQDARFFQSFSSKVMHLDPDPASFSEAQQNLRYTYGNWDLSDFHFTYKGDETRGVLNVFYKNRRDVSLPVVMENGQWKLDSH
jgi:hypothetical protein